MKQAWPNLFEICSNFDSTLIIASTHGVMRVFSVQDLTQPLIPLNAEHSKHLLIEIPNQNCLTYSVKQSACKELES